MSNTVKEELYNALKELIEEELEEFKWKLNIINYNGGPNIPKSSLEKAKIQGVVDLLIQHYGEDALEVCIDVLRKCNRNDLVEKLEGVDAHQLPDLSEYRSYIKNKFETMKDPNAVPGEYVLLNERYSKLMILDYHPSKEEREHEILAMGRKHYESSTSIETLFNPDKHGLIPQVVVLQGAAGIGKTIMAKKIMFDWASQHLYQDKFNYVFYICCRKMNLHAEAEKSNIADIISEGWLKGHASGNIIQNILKNEEKLLFIIDGFDELKYSFDQPENYFCTDPWKKEPVRILLNSLFQKKLLPKSSLIITTRPTALEKLHQCLEHPGYFVILGFSTKEREEYFYNFFGNKEQATQALIYVKQNDTLFTMCVIPLVSWIICTVMKQEMERGKDLQKTPYTLTAIYMLYLSSLLKFHHKESKQDVQTNVKGLCSLAEEGIRKRQILFMEEEVKKHILHQGNSLPLFLNQSIFKEDIDCIQTYSFIHLSFQEFFAALFYVLEEGDEQHSQNLNKNLQTLLETHTSFSIDFAVVFRFLFGFLNEGEKMRQLKKKFGWNFFSKNKESILDWVKNNIKKGVCEFQTEMFTYLYETQDDNFIKNAVCDITEILVRCESKMELMNLSYCIQHCQNLQDLNVSCIDFPKNEDWCFDERNVEDFFEALTQLRNLEELNLAGWSLKETCGRHLADVFKNNHRLKVLYLCPRVIDDGTAELLWEGLQDPHCKIERLELGGDILIESYCRHFEEMPAVNQRLRELQLHIKYQGDKAIELLCDVLKHPQCKIKTLQIFDEIFMEFESSFVEEVHSKKQRFITLYLYRTSRNDKAMKLLCDGLKHPQCTIETLQLGGNILIDSYCRHVAEVLRKNQRLRTLDLDIYCPDDKAMELLCDGLKHSQCTIEALKLHGKILSESGSWHLAEVLRKNQRLKTLCLSLNNPDQSVIELCEVLKQPQCTIEALELHVQMLSESCSRHLADIFRRNHRLIELELSFKSPDNKTMELLCGGLNDPECTIKKLKISGESPSTSFSRHLAKVFRRNQRLRTLSLSLNKPDDQSMIELCEVFKQPQCAIETLWLHVEMLSESCSRHLAEVFRGNQSLRQLELTLKNSDEKTMGLLYEGLKHPECKIETLQLNGEYIIQNGKWNEAVMVESPPRKRKKKYKNKCK